MGLHPTLHGGAGTGQGAGEGAAAGLLPREAWAAPAPKLRPGAGPAARPLPGSGSHLCRVGSLPAARAGVTALRPHPATTVPGCFAERTWFMQNSLQDSNPVPQPLNSVPAAGGRGHRCRAWCPARGRTGGRQSVHPRTWPGPRAAPSEGEPKPDPIPAPGNCDEAGPGSRRLAVPQELRAAGSRTGHMESPASDRSRDSATPRDAPKTRQDGLPGQHHTPRRALLPITQATTFCSVSPSPGVLTRCRK